MNDNIFALSTADLPSAICIFRLTGPDVVDISRSLLKRDISKPNYTYVRDFFDPNSGELIDKGMIFFKKGPHSYTGEDCVELHLHGSRAITQKIYQLFSNIPNLRQADKGEFTKRAFLNGKIDILQAEAIGDLVSATTDYQRRMALEGLDGKFSMFVENLRTDIISMISTTSALIDFADDEVPPSVVIELQKKLDHVSARVDNFISSVCSISEVKNGLKVAILGAPNAGKSSFLNSILGRDAIIVSEIEGTTRDTLEFQLDIGGYPILFFDSAGLRETNDPIELEGIKRSLEIANKSDIIFFLHDPNVSLSPFYRTLDQSKIVNILTKSDKNFSGKPIFDQYFRFSIYDDPLKDNILFYCKVFFKFFYDQKDSFSLSRERYLNSILKIQSCLKSAHIQISNDMFFFSEELFLAKRYIEELTCEIGTEDILENIFSSFCIGK